MNIKHLQPRTSMEAQRLLIGLKDVFFFQKGAFSDSSHSFSREYIFEFDI